MNLTNSNESEIENSSRSFHDRFQNIAEKNSSNESTFDFITRNVGQHAARSGEVIVGMPGNLKNAFLQSRSFLESFLPEGTSLQEKEKHLFGEPEKGSIHELFYKPPTSTELREGPTKKIAKKLTGKEEFFEPRGEKEKAAGELTQDITSFFMPGTGQLRLAVRLGAPIAGNLAKQGAKYLGAKEDQAEKAKLGFMLMTTLAGQSNPGNFARQRIVQAKEMIPETATVNVTPLANSLMPLYNRITRGLNVPSKSKAIQGMKDLASQVENNRISLRSLMDARDNINEWISEAGGWDVPTPVRDASLKNLNDLKTQIITTVDESLTNRFPQASELYRTGYEASAVNHQSHAISNFVARNFGKHTASIGAKLLFPSLVGGAAVLPKTAGLGAVSYPFYKTGQVMYRVANSPTLAKYYQDVINTSIVGNTPAMIKSMEKLDKALAEDEKKEKNKKKPTLEEFKSRFKNRG